MKLFISWSGDKSKEVSELLHSWLQDVIQSLQPWVSSEDIETGTVWFNKICEEIREVCNSIIVVTQENKEKPWIMFEAGALCKGDDTNRVNILLVDVEPKDIRQPLASFNMVNANEDGLRKLMHGLNKRVNEENPNGEGMITDAKLDHLFDKWYPDFEEKFEEIVKKYPTPAKGKRKTEIEQTQEEILSSIRGIEKTLLDTKNQIILNTTSKVVSDVIMAAISNSSLNSNYKYDAYLHMLNNINNWNKAKTNSSSVSADENITLEP